MKDTLTGLTLIIDEVDRVQGVAHTMMRRIFPFGREIYFRRGNMKESALGKVLWARMIQGSAELRVTNLYTGKDRTISFNDVVQI